MNSCALTPDGRFAISASEDRTLKLWDLQSQSCLQTIFGCSSFNTIAMAQDIICAGDMLGNVWVLEAGPPLLAEDAVVVATKPAAEPLVEPVRRGQPS